ncbi:MAG: hypothetical protein ACR2RV_24945 [Verrucomicrobiales bacterium]
MINIDKHTESGMLSLLPDKAGPVPAEVFSLTGNRTQIGPETEALPSGLQLRFRPLDPDLAPPERRNRFTEAERDDILCLLASPDGRFGSLRINAAVRIYTSRLGASQTITFRPKSKEHLWLRALSGRLALNGNEIEAGQDATVSEEGELQIFSPDGSEFVLLVLE